MLGITLLAAGMFVVIVRGMWGVPLLVVGSALFIWGMVIDATSELLTSEQGDEE